MFLPLEFLAGMACWRTAGCAETTTNHGCLSPFWGSGLGKRAPGGFLCGRKAQAAAELGGRRARTAPRRLGYSRRVEPEERTVRPRGRGLRREARPARVNREPV